jgi:hypothetical protein
MEGVNLAKIYCKHFVNVTVYPHYNNNIIKNKIKNVQIKDFFPFQNCV